MQRSKIPSLDYFLELRKHKLANLIEKGIPPDQAEEMIMQHQTQIREFLTYNYDAMEPADIQLINSTFRTTLFLFTAAAVPAVGMNLILNKVTKGRLLDLPLASRFAIRSFLFGVPMGTFGRDAYNTFLGLIFHFEDKYEDKFAEFTKKGNLSALNSTLAKS